MFFTYQLILNKFEKSLLVHSEKCGTYNADVRTAKTFFRFKENLRARIEINEKRLELRGFDIGLTLPVSLFDKADQWLRIKELFRTKEMNGIFYTLFYQPQIPDAELLTQIGTALFGSRWQTELATLLGMDNRILHRIAAGGAPLKQLHKIQLHEIVLNRLTNLTGILKLINEDRIGQNDNLGKNVGITIQ